MAQSASSVAADVKPRTDTLSNMAFEKLRHEVLVGNLLPGERLRIERLSDRYGIGLSPLREALSRLSETGLVIAESQRGYRVAPISIEEFRDVIDARLHIEKEALARSIKRGDVAWEARVVAACHRLSRVHSQLELGKPQLFEEWTLLNREFHAQTISGCGSKWMLRFCLTLYDQSGRYHHRPRFTTLRLEQSEREHKALLRAVIERDANKAVKLLEIHIRSAAERVERGSQAIDET